MKHAKKPEISEILIVAVPILLVIAVAIFLTVRFLWFSDNKNSKYDNLAVTGSAADSVEALTAEELEKMQQMVDKGMITMCINATPMWDLSKKNDGVNWEIENPSAQSTKLICVEIYRDDTGEKIYQTGAIYPGNYISGTMPDADLSAGEYSCTAYFYSYDIDTKEPLGQSGVRITLYVFD